MKRIIEIKAFPDCSSIESLLSRVGKVMNVEFVGHLTQRTNNLKEQIYMFRVDGEYKLVEVLHEINSSGYSIQLDRIIKSGEK